MAKKNFPYMMADHVELPKEAEKMWANLGNLSNIIERLYSEDFFVKQYPIAFQDNALIKDFNVKCAEAIKAYHKLFKIEVESKIKEYEEKIAELKTLIAE